VPGPFSLRPLGSAIWPGQDKRRRLHGGGPDPGWCRPESQTTALGDPCPAHPEPQPRLLRKCECLLKSGETQPQKVRSYPNLDRTPGSGILHLWQLSDLAGLQLKPLPYQSKANQLPGLHLDRLQPHRDSAGPTPVPTSQPPRPGDTGRWVPWR
jgi:hypothetical protein